MAENAVAPWVGTLSWVGEPMGGTSRSGNTWKSVDFTLCYQDTHMKDKYITFSAFGEDRVDKILSFPLGTVLRVSWWPESVQSRDGDRWFSKNSVLSVSEASAPSPRERNKPETPPTHRNEPHFDKDSDDLPF